MAGHKSRAKKTHKGKIKNGNDKETKRLKSKTIYLLTNGVSWTILPVAQCLLSMILVLKEPCTTRSYGCKMCKRCIFIFFRSDFLLFAPINLQETWRSNLDWNKCVCYPQVWKFLSRWPHPGRKFCRSFAKFFATTPNTWEIWFFDSEKSIWFVLEHKNSPHIVQAIAHTVKHLVSTVATCVSKPAQLKKNFLSRSWTAQFHILLNSKVTAWKTFSSCAADTVPDFCPLLHTVWTSFRIQCQEHLSHGFACFSASRNWD